MNFLLFLFLFLRSFFISIPHGGYKLPASQQYEINSNVRAKVYVDKNYYFTLGYDKRFDTGVFTKDSVYGVNFFENGGPWIVSLKIQNTTFSSPKDWIKTTNNNLPKEGKITMKADTIHDGMDFVTLYVPIIVDETTEGKPIYDHNKEVIFIKDHRLYTFMLREQLTDPSYEKDFDQMVSTFHLYD